MVNSFADTSPLIMGDAVALILLDHEGSYVLQHRDDIEGIWYPNKWGCFGGGVDKGETPIQALERELIEEIGFIPKNIQPFCNLEFDLSDAGQRVFYRRFFAAEISLDEFEAIQLGEGRAFASFTPDQLDKDIPLTPYDSFALLLHHKNLYIS